MGRPTSRARWFVLALALLAGPGCPETSTSAPPAAYPSREPSQSRPGLPAWLEEPQRWEVGDWYTWDDEDALVSRHAGRSRLRLVGRTPAGVEWWENATWSEDAPRRVHAILVEPRGEQRELLAAFAGTTGEVGQPVDAYESGVAEVLEAILSGFDLVANGRVVPRPGEFEDTRFDDDDVTIGDVVVHALRMKLYKAMGPAEVVGRIWLSPEVPGKTVRVAADGYLFLLPILSQEAGLLNFGREASPEPELRLPDGVWPPAPPAPAPPAPAPP